MNFESVSIQRFKIGIDYYFRVYAAIEKRNGFIVIKNILNGIILFDNLDKNNIFINGNPIQNINELNYIIFNAKCDCTGEEDEIENKIFDLTFDKTFE